MNMSKQIEEGDVPGGPYEKRQKPLEFDESAALDIIKNLHCFLRGDWVWDNRRKATAVTVVFAWERI